MIALRPFLARLIAPFVSALILWLGAKIGFEYDVGFINEATLVVVEGIVWSLAVFTALYGVLHKWINSRMNPTDAATKTLSERGTQ
jgi:hypothetical protein